MLNFDRFGRILLVALAFCLANLVGLLATGEAFAQTKPAAAPAPPPAAAPTTPQIETGRWNSRCSGEGRTGVLDCLVDSVVPIPGTPNLLLTVSLQVRPGKQRPMLRIVTPLAVLLEPGLSIKFDDGQSRRLPFEYCEQRGCIAGSELPPEMIDALKQGVRVTASFQTATQQNYDVVIPTANFGKVFAKVE